MTEPIWIGQKQTLLLHERLLVRHPDPFHGEVAGGPPID